MLASLHSPLSLVLDVRTSRGTHDPDFHAFLYPDTVSFVTLSRSRALLHSLIWSDNALIARYPPSPLSMSGRFGAFFFGKLYYRVSLITYYMQKICGCAVTHRFRASSQYDMPATTMQRIKLQMIPRTQVHVQAKNKSKSGAHVGVRVRGGRGKIAGRAASHASHTTCKTYPRKVSCSCEGWTTAKNGHRLSASA